MISLAIAFHGLFSRTDFTSHACHSSAVIFVFARRSMSIKSSDEAKCRAKCGEANTTRRSGSSPPKRSSTSPATSPTACEATGCSESAAAKRASAITELYGPPTSLVVVDGINQTAEIGQLVPMLEVRMRIAVTARQRAPRPEVGARLGRLRLNRVAPELDAQTDQPDHGAGDATADGSA